MKKYIWMLGLLFSTLGFWSCADDDGYSTFHYVTRGIDSVAMPDSARLGQRVEVRTYTKIKQNCQQFQQHGYDAVGSERTVTAWFVQWDDRECGEDINVSPFFYFAPEQPGTYQFRFWAGQDEETQQDVFITRNILIFQ